MPRAAGKKPKKITYHHGDLRRALVEAALAAVEAEGHEAVKVREVARAVGVSAAAPFRHFEDRTDLLRAVALEAFHRSNAYCQEEIDRAGDDPLLKFRASGLAFLRFALRHPRLFTLMNLPEMYTPPRDASEEDRALLAAAKTQTRTNVEKAQASGLIGHGDPAIYELAGVALTYGLARLFVDGLLPKEGAEGICEAVVDVLGFGLRGEIAADGAQR
jgi:AcrR family transcriptional regulator